jgi:hypothetical protein
VVENYTETKDDSETSSLRRDISTSFHTRKLSSFIFKKILFIFSLNLKDIPKEVCVLEKCGVYENGSCLSHTENKCIPTDEGCRYYYICLLFLKWFLLLIFLLLRIGNCSSYSNIVNGLNYCLKTEECVILEGNRVWNEILCYFLIYYF